MKRLIVRTRVLPGLIYKWAIVLFCNLSVHSTLSYFYIICLSDRKWIQYFPECFVCNTIFGIYQKRITLTAISAEGQKVIFSSICVQVVLLCQAAQDPVEEESCKEPSQIGGGGARYLVTRRPSILVHLDRCALWLTTKQSLYCSQPPLATTEISKSV